MVKLSPYLHGTVKILILSVIAIVAALGIQAQTVVNNELLRAGNGYVNSIDASGKLRQPFCKSGNHWLKLTYATNALDMAYGAGGDGSNEWNTNGSVLLNPFITNHQIDTTGITFSSVETGHGTGSIISTGNLQIGNVSLEIKQRYELLPEQRYIKVITSVKNVGMNTAENLRTWLGTKDDWVGFSDKPTKMRGNLVDGEFEAINTSSEYSSLLRISSAQAGIFLYSADERVQTVVANCCHWNNIVTRNPNNAPTYHAQDGSYGLYIRFDDLAPGESDEVTWYFAAAPIADLGSALQQVAADALQPIRNVGCGTAEFLHKSKISGTAYFAVMPADHESITTLQLTSADLNDAVFQGNLVVLADSSYTSLISGLASATDYTLYHVFESNEGVFTEVRALNFTTASPLSLEVDVQASMYCDESANGYAQVSVSGGIAPYQYTWSSGEEGESIMGLAPGMYSVEVSDGSDCPTAIGALEIGLTDTIAPVVVLQDITVYLNEIGQVVLLPEMLDAGSHDNCGIAEFELDKSQFGCIDVDADNPQSVTLTATDASGNQSSAAANVLVVDTVKPTFSLSFIELFANDQGHALLTEAQLLPFASDACGIDRIEIGQSDWNCSQSSGSTGLLIFDVNGNVIEASIAVKVEDKIAPKVEVHDVQFSLDASGRKTIMLSELNVMAHDNCGVESLVIDREKLTCADLGEVTLQITASDAVGNQTQESFTVQVIDDMAPVIVCNDVIEICSGIYDPSGHVKALDNCSATLSQISGPEQGRHIAPGTYDLQFMAEDPSGNFSVKDVLLIIHAPPALELKTNIEAVPGEMLTLRASDDHSLTYRWSTGATTAETQISVQEEMDVWVVATNDINCATLAESVITLTTPTSDNEFDDEIDLLIYPNPAVHEIKVKLDGASFEVDAYTIIDMHGRKIIHQRVAAPDANRHIINVSTLAQGVYMLSLYAGERVITKRFSKK